MADDGWDENPVVSVPSCEYRSRNYKQPQTDATWSNVDSHKSKPVKRQSAWGNNSNRSCHNSQQNGVNNIIIEVPSKFIGKIIGRGGSKISDLQFESGARIHITKETSGDNTMIKISGTTVEINKAKEMVMELTIERAPPPPPQSRATSNSSPVPLLENGCIDWKTLSDECDRITKEKWAKLAPIIKEFYEEHPAVTNMTPTEVASFRQKNNNIVVSRVLDDEAGSYKPIPNPVKTFHQAFHNFPLILGEIEKAGFETPSPIQCQAWPILLGGDDLIGIAQTGTGKTLAFLLPALIHIDGQSLPRAERGGPSCLVIAPTRELALQIDREVKKYNYKGIKAVCIYGGGDRKEQVNIVTQGVDIIIATPGRLNDLVLSGYIKLESITYLILDEADKMLDMGFEPQIRKALFDIRPTRQTVMTSATWPEGVRRLAKLYMENPVQVYVGSLDLTAVHSVTQSIVMISDKEEEENKFEMFMEFARNMKPNEKVIVFCSKKARADYLSTELVLSRINCQSIHGDREQVDREQALLDIASGEVKILIATDVASRGLDIEDITHVINYDFPRNIEEYVHRVGRTGRAGRTGHSISYFTRTDWGNANELIRILEEANQYVPDELYGMGKRFESWKERKDKERGGRSRGGGRFGNGGGFGGGGGGFGGGGGRFNSVGGGRKW